MDHTKLKYLESYIDTYKNKTLPDDYERGIQKYRSINKLILDLTVTYPHIISYFMNNEESTFDENNLRKEILQYGGATDILESSKHVFNTFMAIDIESITKLANEMNDKLNDIKKDIQRLLGIKLKICEIDNYEMMHNYKIIKYLMPDIETVINIVEAYIDACPTDPEIEIYKDLVDLCKNKMGSESNIEYENVNRLIRNSKNPKLFIDNLNIFYANMNMLNNPISIKPTDVNAITDIDSALHFIDIYNKNRKNIGIIKEPTMRVIPHKFFTGKYVDIVDDVIFKEITESRSDILELIRDMLNRESYCDILIETITDDKMYDIKYRYIYMNKMIVEQNIELLEKTINEKRISDNYKVTIDRIYRLMGTLKSLLEKETDILNVYDLVKNPDIRGDFILFYYLRNML